MITDHDQGGIGDWATTVTWLDPTNRVDRVSVAFDAGGSRTTDYDQGNAYDWSHIATDLDALGRTVFEEVLADDNTRHETTFDVADTATWDRLEVLTAATGETFTLVTGAEGQDFLFGGAGEDRLEMTIGGLAADDLLTFSGSDLAPLMLGLVQAPAGAKAVELLLTVAVFVWGQMSGSGTPGPSPLPGPNIPADARFFFGGADGTNYYLTEGGQLWQVGTDGDWRLSTTIPNSALGTDAYGACSWTVVTPTTESLQALAYQEQITGLPSSLECVANGVKFDGYDYAGGVYLEAKGTGYAQHYEADGTPKSYFQQTHDGLIVQMERQVRASGGRPVVWHVAEQEFQVALERAIANNFPELAVNVRVVWTPPK